MARSTTVDVLLNLVPDSPTSVLQHLQTHPELASKQDEHGYSLLHAATSYEHMDLLKILIEQYQVDPNIVDEDGETCLFNAESVGFAKALVELGVKTDIRNHEGQTAAEKLDDEDEQPQIAVYLRSLAASTSATPDGSTSVAGENNSAHPPPPLPNGVQVNIGTMQANEVGDEPDPEFRRRIEELAARQDFEGEDSQRELRHLISDAVSDLAHDDSGHASSRRRIG